MAIKTNKPLIFLFSIIATIAVTQAQVNDTGSCPNVQTEQNFNIDAFYGKWYEHSRYPIKYDIFDKCTTVTFTPEPDEDEVGIHVHNSAISLIDEMEHSLNGTGVLVDDGQLYVVYITDEGIDTEDYRILGTDYKSYAAAYSCLENASDQSHGVKVWILTRERHPDYETIAAAHSVLCAKNLALNPLTKTDQTDCSN